MSDSGPTPPPPETPPSAPGLPPPAPDPHPRYTPPEDKTLATVVYVLYLVGLVNGLTALIGFVIAMGSRAAAPPLLETHYRFQIRTMVGCLLLGAVGLLVFIVGIPLMLVLIGFLFLKLAFLIWGASALYLAVRSVVGLIRLSNGEAYPNPDSWTL